MLLILSQDIYISSFHHVSFVRSVFMIHGKLFQCQEGILVKHMANEWLIISIKCFDALPLIVSESDHSGLINGEDGFKNSRWCMGLPRLRSEDRHEGPRTIWARIMPSWGQTHLPSNCNKWPWHIKKGREREREKEETKEKGLGEKILLHNLILQGVYLRKLEICTRLKFTNKLVVFNK